MLEPGPFPTTRPCTGSDRAPASRPTARAGHRGADKTARCLRLPMSRHAGDGTDFIGHTAGVSDARWSHCGGLVLTCRPIAPRACGRRKYDRCSRRCQTGQARRRRGAGVPLGAKETSSTMCVPRSLSCATGRSCSRAAQSCFCTGTTWGRGGVRRQPQRERRRCCRPSRAGTTSAQARRRASTSLCTSTPYRRKACSTLRAPITSRAGWRWWRARTGRSRCDLGCRVARLYPIRARPTGAPQRPSRFASYAPAVSSSRRRRMGLCGCGTHARAMRALRRAVPGARGAAGAGVAFSLACASRRGWRTRPATLFDLRATAC